MNYYPFHVGDFLRDTAHLSLVEDAAYRRLIDRYYLDEGPLPLDAAEAARLIRVRDPAEVEVVAAILREFFAEEADGWHHKRCDAEVERFKMRIASARNANRIRWQSEHDPNQEPITSNQEPVTKNKNKRGGPRKRGTRLPDDWQPGEAEARYARDHGLDPGRVAEKFRNYWHAAAGKGAVKLDWSATWRNWCLRDAEDAPCKPADKPVPTTAQVQAERAKAAGQNRAVAERLGLPKLRP